METVVVGGGIVGLATARALAERGVDVTLCERDSLGGHSTGRSAGGIRLQFSTRVNIELSQLSAAVWANFEERFGVDIGHRRVGYLFLARTEETADQFADNVRLQHDLGVESTYLEPESAREYCPGLRADRFLAATYHAQDGFADPHLAAQAYATAARQAGVDLRPQTAVTDVRRRGEGVIGVETTKGPVDAEVVVNAAGAWAGRLAELAGHPLPIAPRRRQVLVVDPETAVPESVPLTIDLDTGVYFRPERAGTALVGGHLSDADPDVDPDTYDQAVDLEWTGAVLERAADVATYFGPDSTVPDGWAGLYAVTPDHHPIVDEVFPGFVTAAGFSGHGFQHAPAVGRVVAELILEGTATSVDIDSLSADRFEAGDLQRETNVA